jgi:heme A synthase
MVTRGVYWARVAYLVFAGLFVLAIIGQVLLVGLSLFGQMRMWALHRDLGHTVGVLLLPTLILAYAGRLPRPVKRQTWLLLGVYIVQAELFAVIRSTMPLPAALHPVLALVLFWLAVVVAQQAWAAVRVPRGARIAAQPLANPIGD